MEDGDQTYYLVMVGAGVEVEAHSLGQEAAAVVLEPGGHLLRALLLAAAVEVEVEVAEEREVLLMAVVAVVW